MAASLGSETEGRTMPNDEDIGGMVDDSDKMTKWEVAFVESMSGLVEFTDP